MTSLHVYRFRLLLAVFLGGSLSCVDGPTAPSPFARVTATPEALSLEPLETATLSAVVQSLDGGILLGRPLTWRSLDTTIARVNASGVVTAISFTGPEVRGTAIFVTSPGASTDTVPVEVRPWAVQRVVATPATVTFSPGDSTPLTVTPQSVAGVTLTGRTVAWIVGDTAMLRVGPTGRLHARPYAGSMERTTAVIAFTEGVADTIAVTVVPLAIASVQVTPESLSLIPGQLANLSALVRSASGVTLTNPPLVWSTLDTTIARVNADGVVSALYYVGNVTRTTSVVASGGAFADTATVQVLPLAAASIAITPDSGIVMPSATLLLDVVVRDGAGLLLAGRPILWSSTDTTVARVDASGLVTARDYDGTALRVTRIIAASGVRADTITVRVPPHDVFSIEMFPATLTLRPLDSALVVPRVESIDGTVLVDRILTWRSLDSTIARVDGSGRIRAEWYTGNAIRTTGVIGTSAGVADTVPVTVFPLAVARVVLTPDSVTFDPSGSVTLSAMTFSASGAVLDGRAISWAVIDTSVVSVSDSGVVTARPYFGPYERNALVVAYSDGVADSTVIVRLPYEQVLTIVPDTIRLVPSQLVGINVDVRSRAGDVITGTPIHYFQFSTTDTSVARTSIAGELLAGFYVGPETRTALLIARSRTGIDTAVVEVRPLAVTSVTITPDTANALPGATFQLDAVVRGELVSPLVITQSVVLEGRTVAWSSLDTTLARVSPTGLVTLSAYAGTETRNVRVVASALGKADTVTVTIAPREVFSLSATPASLTMQPLDTASLAVRMEAIDGTVLTGRSTTWTSLDTTVARVNVLGLVTASAYAGPAVRQTLILATSGAAVDTIPVEVLPFAVSRIVLSPEADTLAPLGTTTMSAELRAANGVVLTGRETTWLSSDTSIVQVDGAGVVTARPYTGPLARSAQVIVFGGGSADSSTVTVLPLVIGSVTIAPDTMRIVPGALASLAATVRSTAGVTLTAIPLTWSSSDTTVARVNVEGVVTASYFVGAVTRRAAVVATIAGGSTILADTATIEVSPLGVARVTIAPDSGEVLPGRTFQLDAQARDAAGLLLAERVFAWSVSDTAVASVNVSGLVTARTHGGAELRTVQVVATSEGRADTITVRIPPLPVAWVTAAPEALSLRPLDSAAVTARVESLDLVTLIGRSVMWTSLDTTVARVTAGGLVSASAYTGPAIRLTSILVTSAGVSDTVPVEVLPLAVARVIASPAAVTLAPTDSATLTATPQSATGIVLSGRALVWLSSDTAVVRVDSMGRVMARPYAGPLTRTAQVVVYSEGMADTVAVTVTPQIAASVRVAPDTVTLVPGSVDTLSALVRTASGDTLVGFPLTWTASDTTIARVNVEGIVTASYYVGADTRSAVVIATTGALADTAIIVVQPLAAASVVIAPDTGSLKPSATFQLDAAVRDAGGLLLSGRTLAWISLDTARAQVNASGLVTAAVYAAADVRTVRIVVGTGTVADTVELTIPPHAVFSIAATPEALSLLPLDSAAVTASLASIDATLLTGRSVTWISLDTTVARVSTLGTVIASAYTGPSIRNTSVRVSSGGVSDTVPVEVLPLAVARVIASPAAVTLSPSDSAALTATSESATGVVLSGRVLVWLSSDTAVVRVDSTGRATTRLYAGPLTRNAQVVVYGEGKADTVAVTVTPQVAGSVRVSVDSVSLVPGAMDSLSALVRAASGDTLVGFPITWTAMDTSIARVNVEGVVTASYYVGPDTRTAAVIATTGALADTATIVVPPLSAATVTVAPDTGSLKPGATFQLDAAVRDAGGLLLTGRTLTWTSLDTARAQVSAAGLVTAAVYGGADARSAPIVVATATVADTVELTIPPHAVFSIAATPEALSLLPLDSAAVTASLASVDATLLTGRSVTWISLDTTVARVSTLGTVTASAYTGPSIRNTSVLVSSGGVSDSVPVEVLPLAVARVIASPAAVTLSPSDSAALTATSESATGVVLSGRVLVWLSSDTAVVRVDSTGRATARPYAGPLTRTAQVVVYSEGMADTVAVTVTPQIAASVRVAPDTVTLVPGSVDTLSALVRTASGDTLVGFPLTWTASDTTIARVNVEGIVTASYYVGPDTRSAAVIATTGALADTATVEVQPLAAATIVITPDTGSLTPGATFQLDAAMRDAGGLLLSGRTLTWISLDTARAQVNTSGLVTAAVYAAADARTVRIVVATATVADTVELSIAPHDVFSVSATPEALSLQPLDTASVTPALRAIDLTLLTGRSVTWTSLDTTVARVSTLGTVTASAYTGPSIRNTSVRVSSGGVSDTVPVEVRPFAVDRVLATPASVTLTQSDSTLLSATLESATGVVLSDRDLLWLSSDTAVVRVDSTGRATARPYAGPLTRSAQVVVYSEGKADTVAVTVTPQSAASVRVASDSVTLVPGAVDTLSALVRTASGDTLVGFPLLWTAADTTIARVNVEGIVTASFYVGPTTRTSAIIVNTGALADTTTVVVQPLAVSSVIITPDTATVVPGATRQLDIAVRDGTGLLLTGRPITWTTTDTTRATVDAFGLVTAASYGGADTRQVAIVAATGGRADTLALTVAPHTVASVSASPEALSFQPLDTATVATTLRSLDLTLLTGRIVTWASLDTTMVRVNALGYVTASAYTGPSIRNTSLVVTSGAAADTVPVEVLPFAVARVLATPANVTLTQSDSTLLTATLESDSGIVLTGRVRVWLSSDTAVVQVDSTGRATARPYAGPLERNAQVVVYSEGKADTVAVTVTPLAASSVRIVPDSVTLVPGALDSLAALVRSAGGDTLVGFPLTWTATDTTIARVNVEGVVTGAYYVGPDTRAAAVIVTTGALSDTATVRVQPLAPASVAITPDTGSLKPSATFQLDAAVRDAGSLLLTGRTLTWTSLDTARAQVSAAGLVTAAAYGGADTRSARFVVATATVADTVELAIPPHDVFSVAATPEALSFQPFDSVAVTAALRAIDLTLLNGRSVSWTSLDTTVARVSAGGQVTASAYTGPSVRTTSVVVTSAGVSDTVPVEVLPFAVARVITAPPTATISVGDSITLGVTLESVAGVVLSSREILWLSSDTAVARVDSTGRVATRPYAGPLERTALVVAYSSGIADTSTITVTPRVAASVSVSSDSITLLPGALDTLAATVRTAGGDTLTGFPLTWTATDTTIARVNVEGIVTASFYVGPATRFAAVIVGTGVLADTATVQVQPLAVASVAITPDVASALPSATFQLGAVARDAAALVLTGRPVTWTSLDTARARVSATGLVTAATYGGADTSTVRIVASAGGVSDTLVMTIPPHGVFSIAATPPALSLPPLDSANVTLDIRAIDLTVLTGRSVTWTSLDTTVARVSSLGKVTARSYGGPTLRTTSIVVVSGAAADTVPVEVLPFAVDRVIAFPTAVTLTQGDSALLIATLESANGVVLSGRSVVWLSSDTAVVQVDSTTGRAAARPYAGPSDRNAQVVVYSEGKADTIAVTVTQLVAASVLVSPASITLLPGALDTLSALVRTAGGDTLVGFPTTWTATDTTIARVNVEGIVTGSFYVGPNIRESSIIVALGALADTTIVQVLPLAVASVGITPDTGTVLPGATIQLDAVVRDASALFLTGRPVAWSSLDSSTAAVNASGLVTAAPYGGANTNTVRIVASSAAAADTVTLIVPPHAAAWASATPEALSFQPLDSTTLAVELKALDLTVLTDRPVQWSSLDTTVARVDSIGRVRATAYSGPTRRTTSLLVTSGAAVDTIPVEVLPLAVDRVIATPTAVTLSPQDSTTLSLTLESAGGVTLTARDVLWLSSDTAIVRVSVGAVVTARPYAGAVERSAAIVVYSEAKADTVAITVTPLVPRSLAIAPDSMSILPGQQSPFSAVVRDSTGIVLTGFPVVWSSADTTIARVNVEGIVTGSFYVGPAVRTTTVIAALGAYADTVLVRVRPLSSDSVAVFPTTQILAPAQTVALSTVIRDSTGLFLTGRPVTWTSSNLAVATVSDSGVVTALTLGTIIISAVSGDAIGQSTITVRMPVETIVVTPSLATIWIGRNQSFVATLRDVNGVVLAGRDIIWTSSNTARATVSAAGVVTGVATGEVTITATSEGRTAVASIDIFAEPAAAITISFDDSWRGVLENAYPVMQELRLRANIGWITNVNWAGVMTPAELRTLQSAGWSIISHSMTHPYLTQISLDSARTELVGSRARIDSLGFDPRVFIAPFLDHNDPVLAEVAAAGYSYARCCTQDVWTTDTLIAWPIPEAGRYRLAGVDVTDYDGEVTSYNFRTVDGRERLRLLLLDVVAQGKFIDVFFHDVLPADVADLRTTLEIIAQFRPYLITYGMLP